jgi:hypothetical protein
MMTYLSSTFLDLERHRTVVARALRKALHQVVMMEEYAARDQRVEFACQGDVAACEIYLGVFAWRYGHIPEAGNPKRLSVTELEYQAANPTRMTRLTFLLDDNAAWPQEYRDPDPARINDLRARLKERCSAYFDTPDALATEVLAALRVHESTRVSEQLEAANMIVKAQQLGPSYMMNIKEHFDLLCRVSLIELQTAPAPWWNTRLHLVAALAQELGQAQAIVFVDDERTFLIMATPAEIRRRLAQRWPALEQAYSAFRQLAPTTEQVKAQLWQYPRLATQALGAEEQEARHVLTSDDLTYELGIAPAAEIVDVAGKGQRFLQQEIVGRKKPFAALVRDDRLEGLVDRVALTQRVAAAFLANLP